MASLTAFGGNAPSLTSTSGLTYDHFHYEAGHHDDPGPAHGPPVLDLRLQAKPSTTSASDEPAPPVPPRHSPLPHGAALNPQSGTALAVPVASEVQTTQGVPPQREVCAGNSEGEGHVGPHDPHQDVRRGPGAPQHRGLGPSVQAHQMRRPIHPLKKPLKVRPRVICAGLYGARQKPSLSI